MICDRCGKQVDDIFVTKIDIDYVMPGKGKNYRYYVCMLCRKMLLGEFKE